jgi:hypothetical protein
MTASDLGLNVVNNRAVDLLGNSMHAFQQVQNERVGAWVADKFRPSPNDGATDSLNSITRLLNQPSLAYAGFPRHE